MNSNRKDTPVTRRQFIKTGVVAGVGVMMGCSLRNRFDIVIRNGRIVDGSGAAPLLADLGIRNDRIIAIGDLSAATADRIIDAETLAVAPGFIDMHTHTDIELLVNPRAESKIHQGVTTEVAGNCGSSPFPLTEQDRLEALTQRQARYGINDNWTDISGFYRALKKRGTSVNYLSLTGHGDLRAAVVGKNDVIPSASQMELMKVLLAESMEAGSFGMSTGLEYAPGSYAKTDELIELCKVVARKNGIYSTHMRNEDDSVEEAFAEALQICRAAGVSTEISHFKACNKNNWPKIDHLLEMLQTAADAGYPVLADRYPYNAWSTGLTSFLPLWARQGSTDEILARLQNPADATNIREYTLTRGAKIGGWDRIVIADCRSDENRIWEGLSIEECTRQSNRPAFDFIRDLLVEERGRVGVIGFAMDENNLKKVLASPLVCIGSDGNAKSPVGLLSEGKPHPRSYGTFARVLGRYCREEKIFDLSTAVHKMTGLPAQKLGLRQRGILAEGNFADITIFNPATVADKATFSDPHQFAQGIQYVLVNGIVTIENGKHTGAVAGEILRHV